MMMKDNFFGIMMMIFSPRPPPRDYCLCFLAILVRLLCLLRRGLPSVLQRVASRTASITDSSAGHIRLL